MWNGRLSLGAFTQNFSWLSFLNFRFSDTYRDEFKREKLRFAEFMTLLSIS